MHRVIQREEITVIFVVYGDCSASSACCRSLYIYIYIFMHRVIQREETTVIFVVYGDCSASSACC